MREHNLSNSSKTMIVFLLFSFLFLSSNLETQVFVSHGDNSIENDVQTIYDNSSSLQEPDPPTDGDDTEKEGIDEDWMFGKTKHAFVT